MEDESMQVMEGACHDICIVYGTGIQRSLLGFWVGIPKDKKSVFKQTIRTDEIQKQRVR